MFSADSTDLRGGSTTSEIQAALSQANPNCTYTQYFAATSGGAELQITCPTYDQIEAFSQINATQSIINANSEHLEVLNELYYASYMGIVEVRLAICNIHEIS